MIRDVFSHVQATLAPSLALLLFSLFFAALAAWLYRPAGRRLEAMRRLPLDGTAAVLDSDDHAPKRS